MHQSVDRHERRATWWEQVRASSTVRSGATRAFTPSNTSVYSLESLSRSRRRLPALVGPQRPIVLIAKQTRVESKTLSPRRVNGIFTEHEDLF